KRKRTSALSFENNQIKEDPQNNCQTKSEKKSRISWEKTASRPCIDDQIEAATDAEKIGKNPNAPDRIRPMRQRRNPSKTSYFGANVNRKKQQKKEIFQMSPFSNFSWALTVIVA